MPFNMSESFDNGKSMVRNCTNPGTSFVSLTTSFTSPHNTRQVNKSPVCLVVGGESRRRRDMWAANCEKQPREFVKGAKLEVEKSPAANMKPMDMIHWKWVVPITKREIWPIPDIWKPLDSLSISPLWEFSWLSSRMMARRGRDGIF